MASTVSDIKALAAAALEMDKVARGERFGKESQRVMAEIALLQRPPATDKKATEQYRKQKKDMLFSYIERYNGPAKAYNKAVRERNRLSDGAREPLLKLRFVQAAKLGIDYLEVLSVQGFKEETSSIRRGLHAYARYARDVHSHGGKVEMDGKVLTRSDLRDAEKILGSQISALAGRYSNAKKRRPVWYDTWGQVALRETRSFGGFETPIIVGPEMVAFVRAAFKENLLRPLDNVKSPVPNSDGTFSLALQQLVDTGYTTAKTLTSSIFALYTMNEKLAHAEGGNYRVTAMMKEHLPTTLAKLQLEVGGFNSKGDRKVPFNEKSFKYAAFQQIVRAARLPGEVPMGARDAVRANSKAINDARRAYADAMALSDAGKARQEAKKEERKSRAKRSTGGKKRKAKSRSPARAPAASGAGSALSAVGSLASQLGVGGR